MGNDAQACLFIRMQMLHVGDVRMLGANQQMANWTSFLIVNNTFNFITTTADTVF